VSSTLAGLLLFWNLLAHAAGPLEFSEAQTKAATLVQITRLVTWPESAFKATNSPLVIGVIGKHPFGDKLDIAAEKRFTGTHPIQVVYLGTNQPISGIHVLFVSRNRTESLPEILDKVGTKPVLIIGEEERFVHQGGILNFLIRDEQLHIQVNRQNATARGLEIQSSLFQAKRVERVEGERPRK
jgi:hypothetical protein